MASKLPTTIVTPPFRVSYPKVFRPELNDLNGKMEYSVQALFLKGTDMGVFKAAAEAALEKEFGPGRLKWPDPKTFKNNPFRKMDEKRDVEKYPDSDGYPPGMFAGGIFMNFRTQNKPGVLDPSKQEILNVADFYGGCFAVAQVNAFYYSNKGNKGISFGLNHLMKTKDGDPFGSRTRADDAFEAIETATADTGPAATTDDIFG